MSIVDGFTKVKDRILTTSGFKLLSRWTSSQTVEFDDGKTAQEKLGSIDGITDSLTSTSTSLALSAKSGKSLQDQITTLNSNLDNYYTKTETDTELNKKATLSAEANFSGIHLQGKADSIPYIYSSGTTGNVNFRYVDSNGNTQYYSVRELVENKLNSNANIKMNGYEIYWSNVGTNGFRSGTDCATLGSLNNLDIKSHYGVSFSCTCSGYVKSGAVVIDTREGTLSTLGKIYSRNGSVVPVASLSGTTLTIII